VKAQGGMKLAFQLLLFPGTEFTTDTGSMNRYAVGYMMEKQTIEWSYAQVLPEGTDRSSPKVSPLLAKDFSGLPPAYIMLGGYDPLHDEGLAYAEKLKAAGVKVTLADYSDMVHCFIYLQTVLPQAHAAMAKAAEAVAEALDQA
jgi:acetyl esterase